MPHVTLGVPRANHHRRGQRAERKRGPALGTAGRRRPVCCGLRCGRRLGGGRGLGAGGSGLCVGLWWVGSLRGRMVGCHWARRTSQWSQWCRERFAFRATGRVLSILCNAQVGRGHNSTEGRSACPLVASASSLPPVFPDTVVWRTWPPSFVVIGRASTPGQLHRSSPAVALVTGTTATWVSHLCERKRSKDKLHLQGTCNAGGQK